MSGEDGGSLCYTPDTHLNALDLVLAFHYTLLWPCEFLNFANSNFYFPPIEMFSPEDLNCPPFNLLETPTCYQFDFGGWP